METVVYQSRPYSFWKMVQAARASSAKPAMCLGFRPSPRYTSAKTTNTERVMTSWMVLSWYAEASDTQCD